MVKSNEEINKIADLLLDQYDLREELNSITNFIVKSKNGLVYLLNGEIITHEEQTKRTERKIEILGFILESAKKTTLIEGEITLTNPEEM
jgi:uncharacterized protein involved in tellurium resistance